LRQGTLLCDGGHQTNIITGRCDLRDVEVAYRMFERWRQENFFKYMREEFLLDAHSSIHGSSRRTRPAPSPIPSAALWIRRSVRRASISPSSNANTVPPPRTRLNSAARPC